MVFRHRGDKPLPEAIVTDFADAYMGYRASMS